MNEGALSQARFTLQRCALVQRCAGWGSRGPAGSGGSRCRFEVSATGCAVVRGVVSGSVLGAALGQG
eukprot:5342846-Alexandrium_andersonii.AAC.1